MEASKQVMRIGPAAKSTADAAVMITGSARSGTTIVGTLVHSFDNVEYVFEPPALVALFPLLGEMPGHQWTYLYQAYLHEEFLVNAISGRAINTNRADDSSIYNVKSEADIADRTGHSWRKSDVVAAAASRRVAYKIPNNVPYLEALLSLQPDNIVVLMKRGALETIHSLLAKQFFTRKSPSLIWPVHLEDGIECPYWLRPGDGALWQELSEIDRCAYYYVRMNDGVDALEEKLLTLKYADLLRDPAGAAERIAARIGVGFGPKTAEIIASIKPTGKPLDASLLDSISSEFRQQVLDISAQSE